MEPLLAIVKQMNSFLWGFPLLFLLMGTHLYFTIKLRFPQRHILKAIRISCSPIKTADTANLSVFATLATTLAATLGTGNIIGVSTAIALGGPGAIFWCWLTGILGMATSYAECYLSICFRSRGADGIYRGGPMYVWQNGLHHPFIGKLYAFFLLLSAFSVGCSTQSNSVAQAVNTSFHLSPHITGIIMAFFAGLVILGGVKMIGSFCVKLVPPLAILYTLACLLLLFLNRSKLPEAVWLILQHALAPRAAISGAVGSSLILTARYGIARGLFTNEAGIGTAAVTAAATESTNPRSQALVSMTAVFWDTVVMCMITGLVIVTNNLKNPTSIQQVNEAGLTNAAFQYLPFMGDTFLTVCLIAFAVTTLIGWSYLGERSVEFLFGSKGISLYKLVYLLMIYLGAIIPLTFVWECTDLINACMLLPAVALLYLLQDHIT